MNIQNWNNSMYVIIGIALLSFFWRVCPSDHGGQAAFYVFWLSVFGSITYAGNTGNVKNDDKFHLKRIFSFVFLVNLTMDISL